MNASSALAGAAAGHAPAAESPPAETAELIAHILERFHEVHRRDFPEAIRLARNVETVHAGQPLCPFGLAEHLRQMGDDLELHQQREEAVLFPLLLAGGGGIAALPIARMRVEHQDTVEQLLDLAALTHEFTVPPNACASWVRLIELCRKIDQDLRQHLHLEDDVLFGRFG